MRTVQEIEDQLSIYGGKDFDEYELGDQHAAGLCAGLKAVIKLTEQGKTPVQILDYARMDELTYRSWGDDYADMWQSGYSCALYWAAEQYDWADDGEAIFRAGNIFDQPAIR